MKKLLAVGLVLSIALSLGFSESDAASKAKRKRWVDFTAAQKTELMKLAREVCRKRYGAISKVYRLDYYREKVWCTEN